MSDWAVENCDDLRLDLYVAPNLEWEELAVDDSKGANEIIRPVDSAREEQLTVALREYLNDEQHRHLLIIDQAGAGKTVLSLKVQQALSSVGIRSIFNDFMPRLVVHWSGGLPSSSQTNPRLKDLLYAQAELESAYPEFSDTDPDQMCKRRIEAIDYAIKKRRLVVIIDGWDEFGELDRKTVVSSFRSTRHQVRWIFASRDYAVKESMDSDKIFTWDSFKRLRIKAFDEPLQDLHMQKAGISKDWRTWLQGPQDGWQELLELPYHLREIARFATESKQKNPSWSSPSDLFCQFAQEMIHRELTEKQKNKDRWIETQNKLLDKKLSLGDRTRHIERILGAVALEMAIREHWQKVSAVDIASEVSNIWQAAELRYRASCEAAKVKENDIQYLLSWAKEFAEEFQLNSGSTQGNLREGWISFRNRRVQEMWAGRYLTTYASDSDLRPTEGYPKSILECLGDSAWGNLWGCAIRMPVWSDIKQHGVKEESYKRALEVLFERPANPKLRRPTELMWEAEQWLWGNPSLRRMLAELHSHLAAQFERLKENNDPSHNRTIDELLDPWSYVLLCTPNSKLPGDETSFEMGPDHDDRTVFVKFKTPFAIACYTLTRAQMRLWDNGFEGLEDRLAATYICWYDAYYFCRYLGGDTLTLEDGKEYRFTFPTEAQWEYACRAGSTTAYCYGDDEKELAQYAWYDENSKYRVHRVGMREPNAWNLYDMHGNVFEWCSDWYGPYFESPQVDPIGPSTGSYGVHRGGSWQYEAADCQSAYRYRINPSYRLSINGFRVALSSSVIPKSPEADKSSGAVGGS